MKIDHWMSEFYGLDWLRVESVEDVKKVDTKALLEWRILSDDFDTLIQAQEHNFKLVESFIEFKTDVIPTQPDLENPEGIIIRMVREEDQQRILALNEEAMCMNPNYKTRFNNSLFFDSQACNRYYELAIVNNITSDDVITCVSVRNDELVGFFMLKKQSDVEYKGMMTGVAPKARGKKLHIKMQQYLINHIGQPFTLVNTTQLSNMAVIKNHIRSKRNLSKIEHIFYKLVEA